jgi:protein subunit release factor A
MKQEKIILEIRASEGGQDSKLLVEDLLSIYLKSARNMNFYAELIETRSGLASI